MGGDHLDCRQDRLHGRDAAQAGCAGRERDQRVSGLAPRLRSASASRTLEREIRELRQANEILRKASAYFAQAELDRPFEAMIAFIDDHRGAYGVEPICRVLPIAPSTYRAHAARRRDPALLSARSRRDLVLAADIRRVFDGEFLRLRRARRCGGSLRREGIRAARCTVARLMRQMGLQGVVRGREVRTTVSNASAACPLDRVNRQFQAPGRTAVAVGLHLRRDLAGLRLRRLRHRRLRPTHRRLAVSAARRSDFVLDALEQALADRRPVRGGGLVHHSDRGSQYVSIRYTERLAEAGIEPSVGSVGDSYDNALAETINGLYKTEVIRRRGPWRSLEAVEFATWNGSSGSTTAACSSRSETCLPPKPKRATMPNLRPS